MAIPSPELESVLSLSRRFPQFVVEGKAIRFPLAKRFQLEDGQELYFWGFRSDSGAAGFGLEVGTPVDSNVADLARARFIFLFAKKNGGVEIELLEALKQEGETVTFRLTGQRDWFLPM